MVSGRELVEVCGQEHRTILACHGQVQPQGNDRSAALENEPTHHVVVPTYSTGTVRCG